MHVKRYISSIVLLLFGLFIFIISKYKEDYNSYVDNLSNLYVFDNYYTYKDLGYSEPKCINIDFNSKKFCFEVILENSKSIDNIVNTWNNKKENTFYSNAYILLKQNEQHYEVIPAVYSKQVDYEKTYQQINQLILGNITEVDYSTCLLDNSNKIVSTEQVKDIANLISNIYINYDNNKTIYYIDYLLSQNIDKINLLPNKDYSIYINEETLTTWLDTILPVILSDYNTVCSTWEFTTTEGKTIDLQGGSFGTEIDYEKEINEIISIFKQQKNEINRTPYLIEYGGSEIGNTYVEVSLADQHMWTYVNGELVLETDVVTGLNTNKGRRTHQGVWYICFMQKNRTLRGSYGSSFVYRWMRFTPDGQGLHDATWRSKFGGTIYQYNGSHGCVNLPKNIAYALYDIAYVGMPVIIY